MKTLLQISDAAARLQNVVGHAMLREAQTVVDAVITPAAAPHC